MEQDAPQPYRFRDARQERIYRRLRLIGEGPAAFYRDACRLMEESASLESTSHLVGHLLREVEDAVRAVLQPQPNGPGSQAGDSEGHRQSIAAILKGIGVAETEPVAQLWLTLPRDERLHRKAHRNALFKPREVDAEFLRFWDRIQAILDFILERFEERYLNYYRLLDQLVEKETPTRSDAKRLKKNAPNNLVAYRYFFEKVSSPKWLEPLRAESMFSYPPSPEVDGKSIRLPPWPQSQYLQRMAKLDPGLVADIILDIPDTENVIVLANFADAACKMPPEEAVRLVSKAKSWVETPYLGALLLPESLVKLTVHLAEGGYVDEALELARTLLAVRPASTPGVTEDPEVARYLRQRPEGLFRDWGYKEVLRLRMPALVRAGGIRSFRLLCDLLNDAVTIDRGAPEGGAVDEDVHEDLSAIWRSTLEEDAWESSEEILNPLVTAVRNAAEQLVEEDPSLHSEVISTLESYSWTIFKRLALRVLRIFHTDAGTLVYERLAGKDVIQQSSLEREYIQLLQDAFPSMKTEWQNEILCLIDEGPDLERLRDDVDKHGYARRWQWQRLSPLKAHLFGQWADRWQQLKSEFDEKSELPEQGRVSVHWGRQTAVGADKLSSMSASEIVALIKAFRPSDGFLEPSAEDLAAELADAVSGDPERFSSDAHRFRDLAPEYLEGLVRGFRNAAEEGKPIDWKPVLGFCKHVLDRAGEQEAWSRARREVVDLLHGGLIPKGTETSFEFRDQVWLLVDNLVEDPEPSPEYEAQYLDNGPHHLAINSTRGRAMEAAVLYGLWVYRHTKPAGVQKYDFNLEVVPGLKAALERHLEPAHDRSLAVRSVYGSFLPFLHALDRGWVGANLDRIFPADEQLIQLRNAAWETYVCWSRAPRLDLSMLELLRHEYGRAIDLLGSPTLEERGNPPERLGEHLMTFYWHGKLRLADPLLVRFFGSASDAVRGQALGFVGRSLRNADSPIPSEVDQRLRTLWEWRVEASQDDAEAHVEEMAAFGWWFPYEGLDESWALQQLAASLAIAGKTDIDHAVVERMAALAPTYPAATVGCLGLMIAGAQEEWRIDYWSDQAETVLAAALRSGDHEADRTARALINRLAARGFLGFGRLLNGT